MHPKASKEFAEWPCDWEQTRRENLLDFARLTPEQRFDAMMSLIELAEEGRRQLGVPPIGVTKAPDAEREAERPPAPR